MTAHGQSFAQAVRMTIREAQDDGHVFALRAPDLDGREQRGHLRWVLAAHELVEEGQILRHGCFERRSNESHETVIH